MFNLISYVLPPFLNFIEHESSSFPQKPVFSKTGPRGSSGATTQLLGRRVSYGGPSSPNRVLSITNGVECFQNTEALIGKTQKSRVTIANHIQNGKAIGEVARTQMTLEAESADETIEALQIASEQLNPNEHHVTPPFGLQVIEEQSGRVQAIFFSKLRRKGSLDNYLGNAWDVRQRTFAMLGAAKGLKRIHEMDMLHRDIKPENLFVDEDECVSIGDFDRAISLLDLRNKAPRLCGTPPYWAPELIQMGAEEYSPRTDVWALGMTFFQLHTGGFPRFLSGLQTRSAVEDEIRNLEAEEFQKTIFPNFYENRDVEDTIRGMLSVDPFKRLPLDKVIENLSSVLRSLDN